MKKYSKGTFIVKGIFFGIAAAILFTFGVMLLWNWLMPMIFGLTVLTFWQALGMLVLAKILFGGGGHHQSWHQKEKSKMWEHRFKEKLMKAKEYHHGCGGDETETQSNNE